MQLWLLGATETAIVISSKTNLISLSKNAAVFQQLSWVRVVRGGGGLKKLGHRALYAVSQCLGRLHHEGGLLKEPQRGGPSAALQPRRHDQRQRAKEEEVAPS